MTAVDAIKTRVVKEVLQNYSKDGRAVLLATHMLGVAETFCNHVGIMNQGQLLAYLPINHLIALQGSSVSKSLEQVFLDLLSQ